MSRAWMWLQLVVVWLPMWALFAAMNVVIHHEPVAGSALGALRLVVPGALLGMAVHAFAIRRPWPHPFRMGFVGRHVLAAAAFAGSWFVLVSLVDTVVRGSLAFVGPGPGRFLIVGTWVYLVVASAAYTNLAAQRSAMLEAHAARMQLDALRSQLHPHFLFNALHAVVQLIPTEPRAAVGAAERLAAVLRTTIEEQRDQVPLAEEWAFVERYLAIEKLRFGDRLQLQVTVDEEAHDLLLPSFALQTLVENAVRHGVAVRAEATTIRIDARGNRGELRVSVANDGIGSAPGAVVHGAGTGLHRLRERMRWLYGDRARLELLGDAGDQVVATLVVPQPGDDALAGRRDAGDGR